MNYLDITIGDLSSDHSINIYDVILLIDLIFQEQYENLGDLNQDSTINVLDIMLILDIIFR